MPFNQPVIPVDHIEYFLHPFLSADALQKATEKDFKYWLLQHTGANVGFLGLQYSADCVSFCSFSDATTQERMCNKCILLQLGWCRWGNQVNSINCCFPVVY